ncbi:hypothetical protein Hanom_Chr14g01250241 [Helianthus anomalus]
MMKEAFRFPFSTCTLKSFKLISISTSAFPCSCIFAILASVAAFSFSRNMRNFFIWSWANLVLYITLIYCSSIYMDINKTLRNHNTTHHFLSQISKLVSYKIWANFLKY